MDSELNNQISRRKLLGRGCVAAASLAAAGLLEAAPAPDDPIRIIDSHVHLWELKQFRLPWLDHNPLLHRNFSLADYREAVSGLNVTGAVYVEVNVAAEQQSAEADYVAKLCEEKDSLFLAGVIAGDPRADGFRAYVDRVRDRHAIKGVRFLYPQRGSADPAFRRGLRLLGDRRMTFDLQLGPSRLADAASTAAACPYTQFILDHCGGAVPRPFRRKFDNDADARLQRDTWRSGIEAIAKRPNVACKISGIADLALPGDATADDVAPVVNFCLDQFGPDRVLFGGNWPVCLKGVTLRHWIETLQNIVSSRSEAERRKLFSENAVKLYRIAT